MAPNRDPFFQSSGQPAGPAPARGTGWLIVAGILVVGAAVAIWYLRATRLADSSATENTTVSEPAPPPTTDTATPSPPVASRETAGLDDDIEDAGAASPQTMAASVLSAAARKRFRQCYQQGLTQHPDLQGRVTLVIKIDSHGEVVAVDSEGQGLAPILGCLKAAAAAEPFAAPRSGEEAVITVPLSFVRQD